MQQCIDKKTWTSNDVDYDNYEFIESGDKTMKLKGREITTITCTW